MKQQPQKKRSVQLGQSIDWSDQDLDDLSKITPADLKAAEALWRQEAPKPLKSLLQAAVESEKSE